MTRRTLPRYFVGRADAQGPGNAPGEILPPAHVVDSFFIGSRHLEEREWIVAADIIGGLQFLPGAQRASLPEPAQHELAFNEISSANGGRLIEASEVFLFDLQLLEQPAGAPGWNDPVYLYGRLYGPYPEGASELQGGVEGQLTLTRGDLLQGLIYEAASAFRCAGAGAVKLARTASGVIFQNLVIALGVSAVLVVAAIFGWVAISEAVVLHEGSTLLVVANGLRLLMFRG